MTGGWWRWPASSAFWPASPPSALYHRAGALKGRARLTWLLIAGLATGCGMWTTHFIAMLAFKPGFAISYDLSFTLMSLLVAIAASALGFAWAVYGTWPSVPPSVVPSSALAPPPCISLA